MASLVDELAIGEGRRGGGAGAEGSPLGEPSTTPAPRPPN